MFSKLFLTFLLVVSLLSGCAKYPSYSNHSLPGKEIRGLDKPVEESRKGASPHQESVLLRKDSSFSSEMTRPNFFILHPSSQVWKMYDDFFLLRKMIIEDLPHFVPETEYDIPVVLNSKVQRFINYFQTTGRDFFSNWLSRSGRYIPMMKRILEEKGLPADLVYLAMIESGFNVRAKSNKGAVGPWQFIKSTALRYGLRVDSWVDERMDPEKSTVAAANYLSDLYNMFQSWELAAAGYNAGEERVLEAIERYKVADFWEISEYALPRETRDYVPKLMAALIIAKNPEKYGFYGIDYQEPRSFERVKVPPQKSLKDIARVIGLNYSVLRDLNPSLMRGATPPYGDYEIKVPVGYAGIVASRYIELSKLPKFTIARGTIKYRVKPGDSLSEIASRYRVSVSSIKRANGLRSSLIREGQVLKIPAGTSGGTTAKAISYRVRKGDTLWDIASRYDVSVSDIKRWNRLKSSKLIAGDELTIYPK